VPTQWRSLIAAMTAREPANRPTASEAAAALADLALSADPQRAASLTAPMLDAAPTLETRVFEQPEPGTLDAVTVRDPGSSVRESVAFVRLRNVPTTWVILAVAGFVLLVVIAWAIASAGGGQGTAPSAPGYPAVPGQLGVHLKQLQHEVAPN
jgi:hypothetical protein